MFPYNFQNFVTNIDRERSSFNFDIFIATTSFMSFFIAKITIPKHSYPKIDLNSYPNFLI